MLKIASNTVYLFELQCLYIFFSEKVLSQYAVDLNQQSKIFPLVNKNYPSNLGDGWNDQEKTKMLLYLVSNNFSLVVMTHECNFL